MRRGRDGDVLMMSWFDDVVDDVLMMSSRRHDDGIVPCGEHNYKRWRDFPWRHIHCGCRMISWIKKKSLFAIASPMLRRAVREHRRWITQIIRDNYYHVEYTSLIYTPACLLRTPPMCRRCVWDILNLGLLRGMFVHLFMHCSALFGCTPRMILGDETSGENFNACIDFFLDVPIPWRSMAINRVLRRSFSELLVHGGAALAMPKFVHCESIGRFKSLVGLYYCHEAFYTLWLEVTHNPQP